MTMKRYIKLYALLAMTLFVAACSDEVEQAFEPIKIVPGEEIIFSATTEKKETRTIYGDAFDSNDDNKKDKIELQWMDGDCVNIASYQAAGVPNHVAEYKIGIGDDEDKVGPDNDNNVKDSISHEAKSLTRVGGAGLQWSNSENYNFYAVYPSNTQVEPYLPLSSDADYKGNYGLSVNETGASLVGYLPVDQTSPYSTNTSVRRPNMDYAYMTAKKADWTRPKDNIIDAEDEMIDLEFSSLVTALKITLKPGMIGVTNAGSGNQIQISALTLFSESKKNICGNFSYDFNTPDGDAVKSLDTEGTHSQVMMSFGEHVTFTTNGDESLTVTFFLLPRKYTPRDLKLRVHYYVGTTPQFMEATLGLDIPVCEMTYINNLKLKDLEGEVQGSRWFTALDERVYVNQLSMPVAANAFANTVYSSELDQFRTQQDKDITALWNLGVRGFEICVDWEPNESGSSAPTTFADDDKDIKENHSLDNRYIVASEYQTNKKFADQLDLLYNLMFETKDGKTEKTGEPLVLIVTFQGLAQNGSGYNPYYFLYCLKNSIYNFCERHSIKNPDDIFIQLSSQTTVKDMMGKIALIVRPGDDERWGYENLEFQKYVRPSILDWNGTAQRPCYNPLTLFGINSITNDGATAYVLSDYLVNEIPADLKDNMLVIKDWGMDSWDSWHRRFGKEYYYYYATTATNYDKITDAGRTKVSKHKYEDQLLGGAAPEDAPTERKYYYDHAMSNDATAYIQDMVRVVEKDYDYKRNNNITVGWKESLNEKKNAIAGLFQKAVESKDAVSNNIYINNLSGYFITTGHTVSLYPCYDYGDWGNYFSNSGKGGDYLACANTLTPYVYGILSGSSKLSDGTKLAEGPWGLVMMDYIGTATSSQNLTNLIMLNNFSFSLNQKQDVNPAAEMRVELSDEKISPELNILVNWD